ncbi:hypothetical protein QFC21_000570 [Naganishia friedmannii]|uniref:Uncharacterized protein n=1 Tax=Naganishia friedmannii TaxID=89922 RepID=A0ACC2WEF6_9TREE|nr:hypothetical protein QFC21_000570 [Naganishia friedmannii]
MPQKRTGNPFNSTFPFQYALAATFIRCPRLTTSQTPNQTLTPRLCASHHAEVAKSNPMEKAKADANTVVTYTEFLLKKVL